MAVPCDTRWGMEGALQRAPATGAALSLSL
jgi:hypothetical protein